MAKKDDLGAQAELEQSINKAIASRATMLKRQTAEMSAQVQIQMEMCKALECQDLEGMKERLTGISEALDQGSDAARRGSGNVSDLSGALEDADDAAAGAASSLGAMGAAAGALAGLVSAAKAVGAALSAMTGGLMTAANFAKKTASAVFSGLSNTMGWLAKQANATGAGAQAVGQAYEDLKDTVGGLGPEMDAAHGAIDNLRDGTATAGMEGINLASIYGRGTGGLAKAIADVGAIMGEAGNQVGYLTEALQKNTGSLLLANKALGIGGEALAALGKNASLTGQDMGEFTDGLNLQVAYMAKKFGVNVKRMGKNISEMTQDFATFGTMTPKQLATTAAYADKLGISIKGLQGITAKTDDFEGAAMAAAELAGSFGMTIDAMALMSADPAEKAEMVRKAFQETGKDFAEMSRQEKARMAEITGMGADELAGMFDPSKADIGLDDMENAADEAAAGAMTQQEATESLTKAIKKQIDVMAGMTKAKGPLDALLIGFQEGIMKSTEMRAIFDNLRDSMQIMRQLGKKLGKMFVKLFPGVAELLGGVAELFSPKRFGAFSKAIGDAFDVFDKGGRNVEDLIASLKLAFTSFFGSGGDAIKTIKSGAKKIVLAIIDGLAMLLPMAVGALTDMVKGMSAWLKAPKKEAEEGAEEGFGTAILNALKGLWDGLYPAMGELATAAGELLATIFSAENRSKIMKAVGGAITAMFAFMFGGMAIGAVKGLVVGKLVGAIKNKLGLGLKKGMTEAFGDSSKTMAKVAGNLGDDAARLGPKIFGKLGSALSKVGGPLLVVGAALSMSEMRDTMGEELDKTFEENEAKMGMGAAGLINMFTLGLVPDDILLKIAEMVASIATKVGTFLDDIGLGGVYDGLMEQWGGVFDFLAGLGDIIFGIFSGDSDKVSEGFQSMFSGLIDVVKGLGKQAWEWAKLLLPMLGKALLWVWGMAFKLIFMYIPKAIWTLVSGLGKALLAGFIKIKDMVIAAFKGIWKFITDGEFREEMIDKVLNAAQGMVDGLVDGLSGAITYIKEWAADLWASFKEFWGIASDSTLMGEAGDSLVGGLIDKLKAMPEKFLAIAKEAWEKIKETFAAAKDLGGDIIAGVLSGLGNIKDMLTAPFKNAWSGIKGIFGAKSESTEAAGLGTEVMDGLMGSLNKIPQKMMEVFVKGLHVIIAIFAPENLMPMVDSILSAMNNVAMAIIEPILAMGRKIIEILPMPFIMAIESIQQFLPEKFGAIMGMVGNILVEGMVYLGQIFSAMAPALLGPLKDIFNSVTEFIMNVFSGESIGAAFMQMVDGVKMSLMAVLNVFKAFGPYLIEVVVGTFQKLWSVIGPFLPDEFKSMMMYLGYIFGAGIMQMVDNVQVAMVKILKIFLTLVPYISQIMAKVEDVIHNSANDIVDIFTSPFDSAIDKIKDIFSFDKIKEIGANIVSGFMAAVGDLPSRLYDLAKEALKSMMNPFSGSPIDSPNAPASKLGAGIVAGITTGMSGFGEELKAAGQGAMKDVASGMGADDTDNKALIDAAVKPVSIALDTVLKAQNNIHQILNTLKPIDLAAEVTRVGDELAVKNKTVKIQNKPVNITVNLSVTMKADDIATALVEAKLVAQGDNFTPPGQ